MPFHSTFSPITFLIFLFSFAFLPLCFVTSDAELITLLSSWLTPIVGPYLFSLAFFTHSPVSLGALLIPWSPTILMHLMCYLHLHALFVVSLIFCCCCCLPMLFLHFSLGAIFFNLCTLLCVHLVHCS